MVLNDLNNFKSLKTSLNRYKNPLEFWGVRYVILGHLL